MLKQVSLARRQVWAQNNAVPWNEKRHMTPNKRLVQSHISSDRIWGLSIIPLRPLSRTSPRPRVRFSRPYDLRRRKRRGLYSPTGLFRGSGGRRGRHPDRKSFQARRLSALPPSLGRATRISCGAHTIRARPPSDGRQFEGRSVGFRHRWGLLMASAVGRRLTGGAAVPEPKDRAGGQWTTSSRYTLCISRRTDAFLTPG